MPIEVKCKYINTIYYLKLFISAGQTGKERGYSNHKMVYMIPTCTKGKPGAWQKRKCQGNWLKRQGIVLGRGCIFVAGVPNIAAGMLSINRQGIVMFFKTDIEHLVIKHEGAGNGIVEAR